MTTTKQFLYFILTALLAAVGAQQPYPEGGAVEVIATYPQFAKRVETDDFIWLIQFYDSSTHDMTHAAPMYSQIAQVLKGLFHVAAVDISTDDGKEIASKYKIIPADSSQTVPDKPQMIVLTENKKKAAETIPVTASLQPQTILQKMTEHASKLLTLRVGGMPPTSEQTDDDEPKKSSSSQKSSKRRTAFARVTGADFDEKVLNNPQVVLVAFTAPWCGHCKRLEPEFKQAGKALANEEVLLAWVNAEEERALSSIYGVQGFPTIKIFPGGAGKSARDARDFHYEREAKAIAAGVLEEVGRSGVPKEIPELTSLSVLQEECQGSNHICVMAALPHILDTGADGRNKYRDLLAGVSKSFKGVGAFSFLWFEGGSQPDLEKAFDLTFGFPALVAFSIDRKAFAVLHGSFSEKQISSFLHGITTGRQKTIQIDSVPEISTVEPWDGNDGAPIEEEFDLSDLFDEGEL